MPLRPSDIELDLFPRVGYADPHALRDTWRQAHHAAQAVAELGKSWADPRPDDAHTALAWSEEDGGWLAHGKGPRGHVIGWLDFAAASIWIERENPQEGAWIELQGRSVPDARAWVRDTAQRLSGAAAPQPAAGPDLTDLPDHPVATGGAMSFEDLDARTDLESVYEGAGLFLERLRTALGDAAGANEDEAAPRLWPHHFDAASLFVLRRGTGGDITESIGVGVTPPDTIEPDGYWYVSPWSASPGSASPGPPGTADTDLPDLPAGRWHPRVGGSPIAVLPLTDLTLIEDGDDQLARLSEFVAAAFNACRGRFAE